MEEFGDNFFALLDDDNGTGLAVLPEAVPDDVPITYEVPADRTHVPKNHSLKKHYDAMGQWVNEVLRRRREEPKANDKKSHQKQTQVTVDLLVKINKGVTRIIKAVEKEGLPAFAIPETLKPALDYVLPPPEE